MRILLLSAYDAQSHRYWHQGLKRYFSQHEWTILTLPPRHFSWRIRGNPLSWLAYPEIQAPYDLLIATSVVDLSTLRGMQPNLQIPCIYYFHENQFAYPASSRQQKSIEPQMVNLYGALCADAVVFNSAYNMESFLSGVDSLLQKFPDHVPNKVPRAIATKSQVLPVPLQGEVSLYKAERRSNEVLTVIWNHRWEYDKGPEKLLNCVRKLPPGLPICFHVVGQRFREIPPAFEKLKGLLTERSWLGKWGYVVESKQYEQLLRDSHIVISTALHDFQGLSVMEAVSMGCVPLVPDRLAYQELFEPNYRYKSDLIEQDVESESLAQKLIYFALDITRLPQAPNLQCYSWKVLGSKYLHLFNMLSG